MLSIATIVPKLMYFQIKPQDVSVALISRLIRHISRFMSLRCTSTTVCNLPSSSHFAWFIDYLQTQVAALCQSFFASCPVSSQPTSGAPSTPLAQRDSSSLRSIATG